MGWIDGIEVLDGKLTPVLLTASGARTPLSLSHLRKALPSSAHPRPLSEVALDLRTLRRTSAQDYCGGLFIKGASPAGHEVFQLERDGTRVLIPAAALLYALVPRMEAVGEILLTAASLDRVATTLVTSNGLRTRFNRGLRMRGSNLPSCVWMKYQWLTCFQSGRRLWDSVFLKGASGTLGIELPAVTVDANIYGFTQGGTFLATRVSLRALEPMEPPLPFAAEHAPGRYLFEEKHLSSKRNISALHALRQSASRAL